jgi:hypothetical protein
MGLLGPRCWILPDRLRELRHTPAPFSMIVLPSLLCGRTYFICGDVVESLNLAIFLDALEQHMRAENIVLREDVGVTETQIHMCMRSEMKDGVNIVLLKTPDHVAWYCDIAVEEAEIRLRLQHARIVQRTTVVELVERHNVVVVWILDGQVAHKPRSTVVFLAPVSRLLALSNRDFSALIRYA